MKKKKKRLTMQDKAEIAMKVAVCKAIAEHKRNGRPIAIWDREKGRVVLIPASKI